MREREQRHESRYAGWPAQVRVRRTRAGQIQSGPYFVKVSLNVGLGRYPGVDGVIVTW